MGGAPPSPLPPLAPAKARASSSASPPATWPLSQGHWQEGGAARGQMSLAGSQGPGGSSAGAWVGGGQPGMGGQEATRAWWFIQDPRRPQQPPFARPAEAPGKERGPETEGEPGGGGAQGCPKLQAGARVRAAAQGGQEGALSRQKGWMLLIGRGTLSGPSAGVLCGSGGGAGGRRAGLGGLQGVLGLSPCPGSSRSPGRLWLEERGG